MAESKEASKAGGPLSYCNVDSKSVLERSSEDGIGIDSSQNRASFSPERRPPEQYRRRVSCKRDFPFGCGRKSPPIMPMHHLIEGKLKKKLVMLKLKHPRGKARKLQLWKKLVQAIRLRKKVEDWKIGSGSHF